MDTKRCNCPKCRLRYKDAAANKAASKVRLSPDFERRAKAARTPVMSLDVWSRAAHDMVRMAVFAGFDAKALILACLRMSRGAKVTITTVDKVLTVMSGREL